MKTLLAHFTTSKRCLDTAAGRVDAQLETPETYQVEERGDHSVLQAEPWFVMAVIGELANDGNDCLLNVEASKGAAG